MSLARGTSNTNVRGSAAQRRARKKWLLETFGDGTTAPCSHTDCDEQLTFETLTVDRWPIPGVDGGTYDKSNIRPMCLPHNSADGNALRWGRVRAAQAAGGNA